MCSLILLSFYSNDQLKYHNCVIKTCFQRGLEFINKNAIYKEKVSFLKRNWNCYERKITYEN